MVSCPIGVVVEHAEGTKDSREFETSRIITTTTDSMMQVLALFLNLVCAGGPSFFVDFTGG